MTNPSTGTIAVWPELEPFVAALARHLDMPRTTTRFAVSDASIVRAADAFTRAALDAFGARIDATSEALTSSWPKGRPAAGSGDAWHIDAFVPTFLVPPSAARWFDGATLRDAESDERAAQQERDLAALPMVDAPIVAFALGALWARHLAHRFHGRWLGAAHIDAASEDFLPSSLRISGFATVTFPFQRAFAKLRAPGEALWTSAITFGDALPPIGLAHTVEDARRPDALEALMPKKACDAFTNMQALGAERTLAVLDEVLDEVRASDTGRDHALVLTLAMGIASSGDLVRAASYARRVVAVHRSLDTRYRLADVLACIDDARARGEAIDIFRGLLDEQPQMHRTRLKLAYCLHDNGQADASLEEFRTLVAKGWGQEKDAAEEALRELGRL